MRMWTCDPLADAIIAEREQEVAQCLLAREARMARGGQPHRAGSPRLSRRLLPVWSRLAALLRLAHGSPSSLPVVEEEAP